MTLLGFTLDWLWLRRSASGRAFLPRLPTCVRRFHTKECSWSVASRIRSSCRCLCTPCPIWQGAVLCAGGCHTPISETSLESNPPERRIAVREHRLQPPGPEAVPLVSLGCYCGPKLSFQKARGPAATPRGGASAPSSRALGGFRAPRAAVMSNCCSHGTLLHFGLRCSHSNICYYHQDRSRPGSSLPTWMGPLAPAGRGPWAIGLGDPTHLSAAFCGRGVRPPSQHGFFRQWISDTGLEMYTI